MAGQQDYYEILHVHADAPLAIIRASYRTLMQQLKHHPDLGGDHDTAALINEAYATLTNVAARAAYDESRQETRPERPSPAPEEASSRKPAKRRRTRAAGTAVAPAQQVVPRCAFCGAGSNERLLATEDALCARCESPLGRLRQPSALQSGQRALDRQAKTQIVRVYTSWPEPYFDAESRDISLRGMLLAMATTAPRLRANQVVKLDCPLCKAVGRIAHLGGSGAERLVGLEFLTLRFEQSKGAFVSAKA